MLFWICQILVFLTGFTGLVYQVTWQKYLSNFLGSHASATTIILGVFFLFLTLGYLTIGRASHRLMKNQFLLYGVIEGLIGLYCLFSPVYFTWLNSLFSFHVENASLRLLVDASFACLFIGFPTWLMGATIPVLTEALSSSLATSHRTHAIIYGVNTAGAFLGTLVSGFVLIERLGLTLTLVAASFVNLFVCGVSYLLARDYQSVFAVKNFALEKSETSLKMRGSGVLYLLSFLSGFYFFSFENLFIRLAGLSLGSSTYTYSIIVSAFIVAIALGSLVVSKMDFAVDNRFMWRMYITMFAAFTLLYLSAPHWPAIFLRVRWVLQTSLMNHGVYWALVLLVFFAILILPVGVLGMGLPVLFSYLRKSEVSLNAIVGKLYAANSIGCTLGTFIGGYVLYNFVSIDVIFKINLFLIALGASIFIYYFIPQSRVHFFATVSGALIVIALLKPWNEGAFVPGAYLSSSIPNNQGSFTKAFADLQKVRQKGQIIFTRHDPNTTVHVKKYAEEDLGLYVNGKPDALTRVDTIVRSLTPLIPLSFAPKIERVFIVGLGAGLSTGITAGFKENQTVHVAEISKGVIDAVDIFANHNKIREHQEKIKIINGDAFKILHNESNLFDVILCEPSNPWVNGVDKLYTYEFLKQVAAKLTPTGIYSQWFLLSGMDDETLRTVLYTFNSVFPWMTIWSMGGTAIAVMGSKSEPKTDFQTLQKRYQERQALFNQLGFHSPMSILTLQAMPPLTGYLVAKDKKELHDLAHPTLGYLAARGYFAQLGVNLDTLVGRFLLQPFPENLPGSQFIYENLKTVPPVEFYRDGLRFLDSYGIIGYVRNRLAYDFAKNHPAAVTKDLTSMAARFKYLLGEGSKDPWRENKDLPSVVTQFDYLTLMHLNPKVAKAAQLFPAKCVDTKCVQAKSQLLQRSETKTAFNFTEADFSDLNSEVVKRVEKDFAAITGERPQL